MDDYVSRIRSPGQNAPLTPPRGRREGFTDITETSGAAAAATSGSPFSERSHGVAEGWSSAPSPLGHRSVPQDGDEDRFIPRRDPDRVNEGYSATNANRRVMRESAKARTGGGDESHYKHSVLLRDELLGHSENSPLPYETSRSPSVLQFGTPPRKSAVEQYPDDGGNLSPLSPSSLSVINSKKRRYRKIPKSAYKVLDAPGMEDDYYLSLVTWSAKDVLAVALQSCLYLWDANSSTVTQLLDLGSDEDAENRNIITSLCWSNTGRNISVADSLGKMQIWDASERKHIRSMNSHRLRIGALTWHGHLLASGSRDRSIKIADVRCKDYEVMKISNHTQEVCGLKWSCDGSFLASGGNDNALKVWDPRALNDSNGRAMPLHDWREHTAAVKAVAWSPHQHGILASGGGTADKCIKTWNVMSGKQLNSMNTGSQVCNLAWASTVNEIISTHGFSKYHVALWSYPSLQRLVTLQGHTARVLHLALSPDGTTAVTGAGDETLRFWKLFPPTPSRAKTGVTGIPKLQLEGPLSPTMR